MEEHQAVKVIYILKLLNVHKHEPDAKNASTAYILKFLMLMFNVGFGVSSFWQLCTWAGLDKRILDFVP